jgi:putative membrane protein
MTSALVSSLHILAFGMGLGSVFMRGIYLRRIQGDGIQRMFMADNVWGLAALLWIATGLLRAFAGLEKGTHFYLESTLFWVKMGLFVLLFSIELFPMITFIRWRIQLGRGERVDTSRAAVFARINDLEIFLVLAILVTATFMARAVV